MSARHEPMARVGQDAAYFLTRPEDGGRWPAGTNLYAESPLILAAPDLLEALEEIINTEWIGGKGGFHRARAAIAKARGNA